MECPRIASLDPYSDQSPLYDVRNPARPSITNETCEALFSRTISIKQCRSIKPSGGARRDRTDDLMLAKHALSQLSYGPDWIAVTSTEGESGRPGQI